MLTGVTRGDFSFPTTILFGAWRIAELRERLAAMGAERPLVVTDGGLVSTPAFRSFLAAAPREHHVYSDVRPNPDEDNVTGAAEAFARHGCDCVIGVGGGSALDVAKVLRVRALRPNWQLRDDVPDDIGPPAPFVAIPTTAGTGSEVGRSSVITIGGQKRVIFHPALLARLVVLDPELTVDLPPKLTAATGADALTHCIESFTSPTFHPLCDGIALEGIRLIAQSLTRAVREPKDLDARGNMLVAATMGGIAFQKDLGAAHALAHPLSAICGVHHGLANALVLPAVMAFNAARNPGVYQRVAIAIGLRDTSDASAIDAVSSLLRDIGIAPGLRNHGVNESHLAALTEQAFADACHKTNPVPVTRDDLARLYREAM
jgi:4-hydroxybutyrate dehydrogenase